MNEQDENFKRELIRKRVHHLRQFYSSVISYFFINILLAAINFLSDPHHLWFYWVSIVWGIVLLFQGLNIFLFHSQLFGEEWEKKKVDELMDKEKKKQLPK